MIRDKNALQLEKNKGMGNGPTADGYMRSFWKKKSISQLVKLVAIFYAQVHVNVKEDDFCAVLTRKQQNSNEMYM